MTVIYLDEYRNLSELEHLIKQLDEAGEEIDRIMRGSSWVDIAIALNKARIIIENGGTVAAAIYRATGCEPFDNGPNAA